jgi:hypothetical protein
MGSSYLLRLILCLVKEEVMGMAMGMEGEMGVMMVEILIFNSFKK